MKTNEYNDIVRTVPRIFIIVRIKNLPDWVKNSIKGTVDENEVKIEDLAYIKYDDVINILRTGYGFSIGPSFLEFVCYYLKTSDQSWENVIDDINSGYSKNIIKA